jgi:ribosomal protein S18 acetylase RimI-like enzyme
VGWLSNLLTILDGSGQDQTPPVIRLAQLHEIEPAVRLILAPAGTPVDVPAARDFITFARERGIDFDTALYLAERGGKLLTAALPVVSPGRTMLILLPGGLSGKAVEIATRRLMPPVCELGRARDVHLAQALIDPQDATLARALEEAGFSRMAQLHYLQVTPPAGSPAPMLPAGLQWVRYSEQTHDLFGRTIVTSYQQSLDCPALSGLRDVEDIIAGHKASGAFDPNCWFLLQEGDRPIGVLLLNQTLRGDAIELTYLGLLPEARGRKLGELMLRQALAVAARLGHSRFCLAVDAQNLPALKLYYRHGMQRVGTKLAMLKDLRKPAEQASEALSLTADFTGNSVSPPIT